MESEINGENSYREWEPEKCLRWWKRIKKKVRWSDADKNRKATNTADKTDRSRVCDCCPRELSDSCSVTTGLLCTQFIVSLYLISLYRCHFPPPSLPPRHPGTFVFPLQQLNGLLLSFSNLDIRSALSLILVHLQSSAVFCFFFVKLSFLSSTAVVCKDCNYLPRRLSLF